MLFNSEIFVFLFLPFVLLLYYLTGRINTRAAVLWLVAASLFFYGWWNPKYLILIVLSMGFNYGCGQIITRHLNQQTTATAKTWLIIGIVLNLGALFYFKYLNFFVDTINFSFGTDFNFRNIILPLAISFFTFQQITYLVDSYQEKCKHYDFLSYALFVSFFPQLVAGPIVHHAEMMPQFQRPQTFKPAWDNLTIGISIFVLGLFKKVILADNVAAFGTPMFDSALAGGNPDFIAAWTGTLAYTFQLYFDFSGYSDMALGIARMFGIVLPQNFNSPYRSRSIIEFWRRWHMTLSRFLRDYLYIPLGGNRLGPARRYINLFTTMLIGGLWHGAAWTFVMWGGLHGIYLLVNHAWQQYVAKPLPRMAAIFVTFIAVVFAWVYFRSESFASANAIVAGLFGFNGFTIPGAYQSVLAPLAGFFDAIGWKFVDDSGSFAGSIAVMWVVSCAVIAFAFPNSQEIFKHYEPALNFRPPDASSRLSQWLSWRPNKRSLLVISALAAIAVLSLSRPSEFLYFQF